MRVFCVCTERFTIYRVSLGITVFVHSLEVPLLSLYGRSFLMEILQESTIREAYRAWKEGKRSMFLLLKRNSASWGKSVN